MAKQEKLYKSSGNVFEDIGSSHPERVLDRAKLMERISEIIEKGGLTQEKAGKILGLPQSKVSALVNGKLSIFSLEHLFELLNALDSDVEIIVKPRTQVERVATTSLVLAALA